MKYSIENLASDHLFRQMLIHLSILTMSLIHFLYERLRESVSRGLGVEGVSGQLTELLLNQYTDPLHIMELQPIWRTKQNKISLLGIEIYPHLKKKSYCSVLQIGCIPMDMLYWEIIYDASYDSFRKNQF